MTTSPYLHALAKRHPNIRAVLAELANLEAILTLPKPTVHVVSDVHGEDVKLRQIVNNASGSLRPLLARLFAGRPDAPVIDDLLQLFYYPRERWLAVTAGEDEAARGRRLRAFVDHALVVARELARHYTLRHVDLIVPDPFDPLLRELVFAEQLEREDAFIARLISPFLRNGRELDLVRMLAHVVRNLSVGELVVAGDLGDRGPRIDHVIELLEEQPNVTITWGNHDGDWMAACLGQPAAIATVVRLSLRYQRLAQLEEGYGISLEPLVELARSVYGDDPAAQFGVKGAPPGDPLLIARMQKAAMILQAKLEGALFLRHPEWQLAHRALLHRIDLAAGTVEIDGVRHPLLDRAFPTLDPAAPYALSAAEQTCMDALTRSFVSSATLWRQMSFVASHGQMLIRRDRCAIFHGCIPVDEAGAPLGFPIDGVEVRGKAMFEAFDRVVQRAFRHHAEGDIDLVFYLWIGPRSPCFGKDRMATFETYFLADPATHVETKNPYFRLLDDPAFCARVLAEVGVDPVHGFIINGHVPVKLDEGEQPMKKSGRAITIDGAFAAAYGDKGFSLVLAADRMYLAQHHHFETGGDIIPVVSDIESYDPPRTVAETEKGDELRGEIAALEELIRAYEVNAIRET